MIARLSRRRSAVAAALLAATALGGLALWPGHPAAQDPGTRPIAAESRPLVALPGFADLVARVRPAVVTITTTARIDAAETASPFPPDSPQDRMFRRFFGSGPGPESRRVRGLGSGFLIDAEGHVVTNDHVVGEASSVTVTLDDGRDFAARVVGRDPRTDIALLKIEADGPLPHLALGDSDRARPGDWAVAVGNPFGLGGTVTAGIISARGRDIGAGPYDDFLQVDAPINRGNSGGPLIALDGSVIGVNTAIVSPTGGSVGIGFAIPSDMVRSVVAQLKEHGHVARGFLGVLTQPVTPAIAEAMGLGEARGALVAEVERGSPADRAGLRAGDVVTKVGAQEIDSPRALARAIGALRPGASAPVTIRRDGEARTLAVTLAELHDDRAEARAVAPDARGRIGLALAPLGGQARRTLDLPPGTRGALVAEVRPGSPAEEAGLRPGDVIQQVGGKPVDDAEQAAHALREALKPGSAVALRILREGRHAFVAVEMPRQG
ncbi:DegQ family serine endoprotease [Elioraea sp.]|uniref:DegQ family serine endoprotease n=1 Tax=Elioraea sp. TaxID=2185103 RepID=UPI00307F3C3C